MATARSAWGIDIGNRALKAIKVVRDGARLRVDDVEVIEHEQILSTAGDNRESLIATALSNFAQRHSTKGSVVGVSVSGQASFARFIKLPPVEPKKIPEIVRFEAIQQIPFPLDDVEWSYQLFQNDDSPEIEVGIFAMRKELVNNHIHQFTNLEMNVQVVQTSPLAVYNAMQYDGRLGEGATMIVDCGAENTDLVIADGETVWLRTISIGGNNFSEALTKSFKLNFPKAEDLKRNAATSKYQRQIFQAMRPVFADFVSEIQRSLGFYGTVHRDSKIKRILALGNTFRLPTLQKYLQQNMQIEVQRLDGFSGGAPTDGRQAAMLNENLGSLCTAYGLAVQAMGDAKINSSLLPETIRKAKLWKEKTPWFALAAACFVLGTAGAAAKWYVDSQNYEAKEQVRQKTAGIIAAGQGDSSEYDNQVSQGQTNRNEIAYVNSMLSARGIWQAVYTDITSRVPSMAESAATLKQIPRDKREQIVVHTISSEYRPHIADVLTVSDTEFKHLMGGNVAAAPPTPEGTPGATPANLPPGADTARGFLLTLRCTTPNAAGSSFVQEKLINILTKQLGLDEAQKNKRPFYIPRAAIASDLKVAQDQAMQALIKPIGGNGIFVPPPAAPGGDSNPFARRPGATPAPAAPVVPTPDPNAPVILVPDPVTGEEMSNDASVTVLIAVVLEPPPASATPAPPAAGTTPRASAQ
jgi:type IV pilus assembly protein PilM